MQNINMATSGETNYGQRFSVVCRKFHHALYSDTAQWTQVRGLQDVGQTASSS